jgi:hypothetical protein
MNSSIILIGPIGVGKTTVGRLLAESLGLPLCSVDDVRSGYYEKIGYDKSLASSIAASEQGIRSVLRYTEPFDVQMIKMLLVDFQRSVIDLGASNSVYEDKGLLAQVEHVLEPYPNVILLIPSPDKKESVEILKDRLTRMLTEMGKPFSDELFKLNEYFIQQSSNYKLAKRVIYTKDKASEVIQDEIISGLVY